MGLTDEFIGAGVMVLLANHCLKCQHPMSKKGLSPSCLLSNEIPANVSGEIVKYGTVWVPASSRQTWRSLHPGIGLDQL